VRIARDLLGRCRALTTLVTELDRELQARTHALAPRLLEPNALGAWRPLGDGHGVSAQVGQIECDSSIG
jgi:hypothetical protein